MNQEYKRDFIRAGELAREVRAFGKSLIVKGASYNHTLAQILQKISDLGARPAFPPQIAFNEIAAHFLPQPGEDLFFSDQVIKLDIGVCYQGAIGDCAVTVDLSGKHQILIDAAEAALLAAEKSLYVGQPVKEIGKIIDQTITSYGLSPIRNLGGHGLGYYKIHTPPTIPNCEDRSTAKIKPGMTFAIEPFATNGKGAIYESGDSTIFALAASHLPRSSAKAKELLALIKSFDGLPFSLHDLLAKGFPFLEMRVALEELVDNGTIMGYPPLVEEAGGLVAQAENSVLIDEKGQIFITTR
jgi:methionyl aminopeptidase